MKLTFLVIYLFILERESEQAGGGAERESSSGLPTERGAWRGAQSRDPEIVTWPETKSQTLN